MENDAKKVIPKVSIIIPVYNAEKYIERCAKSLFEQTLDELECIFIDDCSTDNSMKVLNNVMKDYPQRAEQVHIISLPTNSGVAKVREIGIKSATGESVIHCDSDDWTDSNMYEVMYQTMIEKDVDMVFCDYYEVHGKRHKYIAQNKDSVCDKKYLIKQILAGSVMGGGGEYSPNAHYTLKIR